MTTSLEKIVRPVQLLPHAGPLRATVTTNGDKIITLKIDLAAGGSGSVKTVTGNYSFSQSFYVEAYVNEQQTPDA